MTERTTFETALADAFDRYLTGAPVEVDAAQVMRAAVAARPAHRRFDRSAPLGRRRSVAIAVVILALSLIGAAIVGSQLTRDDTPLPPPFGPARNGLLAYAVDDDLFVTDPVTRASRMLAAGVGGGAQFSRDGTSIATTRVLLDGRPTPLVEGSICAEPSDRCTWEIVLTSMDGRSSAIPGISFGTWVTATEWSPDGRWLLVEERSPWLVATDGSVAYRLGDPARDVDWYQSRFGGGDGPAVWFLGTTETGTPVLRTTDLDGRSTPIVIPLGVASDEPYVFDVSPDGSRIAVAHGDSIRFLDASGTATATITMAPGSGRPQYVEFSPDGSQVLARLFHEKQAGDRWPANSSWFSSMVLPADGSTNQGPEFVGSRDLPHRICSWAPDGLSLVCNDALTVWYVPVSGAAERDLSIPVSIESSSAWQRLAID